MNKLVIVGHICNDLPGMLGGASSFASVVAGMQKGLDVTVVTRAPDSHPRMDDLRGLSEQYGFKIVNLGNYVITGEGNITTFANEYDAKGNRQQIHPDAARGYDGRDARIIGSLLEGNGKSALLIGTVSRNEVTEDFLQTIGNVRQETGAKVTLLPQGLVRNAHPDTKRVTHDSEDIPWKGNEGLLRHAVDTVILSEEDLHGMPPGYEHFLSESCNSLVITRGGNGGTIYMDGQRIDQPAFHLTDEEVACGVWTGSGDTVATITTIGTMDGKSLPHAFAEAQIHVAAKICAGMEGIPDGLPSIPDETRFHQFLNDRKDRVGQFVQDIEIATGVQLSFEGQMNGGNPERI